MNRNVLKLVGAFLFGSAAGTGLGFMIAKSHYKTKYQEIAEKDIEETKAYLNEKYSKRAAEIVEKTLEKEHKEDIDSEVVPLVIDHGHIPGWSGNSEEISIDKFNELDGYDDCTMLYYPEDDMFVIAETNIPVEDPASELGEAIVNKIRSGEKEAYCLNDYFGTKYEVVRQEGNWSDTVNEEGDE